MFFLTNRDAGQADSSVRQPRHDGQRGDSTVARAEQQGHRLQQSLRPAAGTAAQRRRDVCPWTSSPAEAARGILSIRSRPSVSTSYSNSRSERLRFPFRHSAADKASVVFYDGPVESPTLPFLFADDCDAAFERRLPPANDSAAFLSLIFLRRGLNLEAVNFEIVNLKTNI